MMDGKKNKEIDTNEKRIENNSDVRLMQAFNSIVLTDKEKADIWQRIDAEEDVRTKGICKEPGRQRKGRGMRRIIALAASILLIISGIGIEKILSRRGSGDAQSLSGLVYAAENRVTDMTADEVLFHVADPASNEWFYLFAPKIYYLDDDLLIFGNGAGLVLYDLKKSRVSSLIDMQAICSGYYNTDTVKTHVYMEKGDSGAAGTRLIVYNTKMTGEGKTGTPFGFYHVFDLSKSGEETASDNNAEKSGIHLLESIESGNEKEVIAGYILRGSAYEDRCYADALDSIPYLRSAEMNEGVTEHGDSYSELAYLTESKDGRKDKSILIFRGHANTDKSASIDDNQGVFELYTVRSGSAEPEIRDVNCGITEELRRSVTELNKLPAYHYTGDDEIIGAVSEYLSQKDRDDSHYGSVCIPSPVILKTVRKNDEVLVFGNFWTFNYVKTGNTLVSVSGGECPARIRLVKDGDKYKVADFTAAEDGDYYAESIREFTRGYLGLYSKFMSIAGTDSYEQVRRDTIKEYVEANELGIEYFKDFGWDPVPVD